MPTTPEERLILVYESYRNAYERRAKDWQKATTLKQAKAIAKNVDGLESAYLQAARNALDANGANVEAAFAQAKLAKEEVEKAYRKAKKLTDKIKTVSELVNGVGDLVKKASGN